MTKKSKEEHDICRASACRSLSENVFALLQDAVSMETHYAMSEWIINDLLKEHYGEDWIKEKVKRINKFHKQKDASGSEQRFQDVFENMQFRTSWTNRFKLTLPKAEKK